MLITPDRPTSYDAYALDTARATLRELIEVLDTYAANSPEAQALKDFNINRVYSALAQLARIEL